MKNILLIITSFIFMSCSSQNIKLIDSEDMTKNYDLFNAFVDKYDPFKEIVNRTNYKIYEEDSFYYLEGSGIDQKNNNVIFRIQFTSYESNTLFKALAGESCTGVDCEHCAFKKGGGCECKSGNGPFGAGKCNHTITRAFEEN